MAIHTIIIDSFIGDYGYSKQFIRNQLAGHEKDQVILKISSLGGDIDHALSIHDQLIEHGNVTAELSAFVASAATLLSLGAGRVTINENSFYLIHKAMYWVDEWNCMNEDEIEFLIEKLEKQKQELSKVTLQLAKIYVKKTGRSLEEITNLMKEDTWLTAQEALEWGFVDEITEVKKAANYLENEKMVAMITSSGMPPPRRKKQTQTQTQPQQVNAIDQESLAESIWNRIIGKQKQNSPSNTFKMNKQFINVNKVLNVESLVSSEEGVFLNREQFQLLEDRLSLDQQIVTERDNAVAQRDNVIAQRDTAQNELSGAYELFDAIDTSIAEAETKQLKAEAIRTLLAARPGSKAEGNHETRDSHSESPKDADWDVIDNLAHNKSVDLNS
jgi:ATP-dependent Clp protease, protease subunit